ncbi:hypothetical protein GL50803_003345 [Giardia duodenalis]|uniref:Uncharacterized protein n=1 Tax=Giardia intestinalis (strain ATCC 50803 / WB clone C6) TaxID=184922 RepID=A8B671_GIAIC|nr:hypothetical protein GL50803_003345 [Giardia intestinalis]KAE8305025.1 hypothetical protein GL50803_003345 [Giardia intestinalis]|eukprot:XP_001709398.1 Hypothetical protein GL50803_3345 [Giardia lamblia ATCC 50803]
MSRDASNLLLDEVPYLSSYQVIGQNVQPLGSSLFALKVPGCQQRLKAQLPCKFNDRVFFGKHKFCLATLPYTRVELGLELGSESGPDGARPNIEKIEDILAVIDAVLTEKNIFQLVERGDWPEEFKASVSVQTEQNADRRPPSSNHRQCILVESSSSDMYY